MTDAEPETDRDADLGALTGACRAVACAAAAGRALLGARDAFVAAQSRFDRQARLGVEPAALEATEAVYLSHVRCQVMDWTPAETAALRAVVAALNPMLAQVAMALPPVVRFVKTSGQEEGDAAYTRGADVIALPVSKLGPAAGAGADALHPAEGLAALRDIVAHELSHILSKTNPRHRRRLYALLGCTLLDAPVALPDAPAPCGWSWPELKITNPDAPTLDVRVELPDADGAPTPMTPVLLARGPYAGGAFFDYLQWSFMALEPDGAGGWRPRLTPDGGPVLRPAAAVMEAWLDRVGRNFGHEIFHPEEVLAQSFVLTLAQPDMGLLLAIQSATRA